MILSESSYSAAGLESRQGCQLGRPAANDSINGKVY